MTRRHGPQVLCVCGVPVDLAWAARTGRTTHLACDPPAAEPEPVPAAAPTAMPRPPQAQPRPPQTPTPPRPATSRAVTSLQDLVDDQVHNPADELEWQERALCAQTDPEAFFPEKGGSTRDAKAVCFNCEVRTECLKYALDNDERFGIWGGLSERERRKAKRERGDAVDDQGDELEDVVSGARTLSEHCSRDGVLHGWHLGTLQSYASRGEFVPSCGKGAHGGRLYDTAAVVAWLASRNRRQRQEAS